MRKTKLFLSIAATACTLALSITGTLMYFTAESPQAVNVISLKGLEVFLKETGANSVVMPIDEDNKGLSYENVTPGETLVKAPQVYTSTSSVTAFIRVSFSFSWFSQDGETPFAGSGVNEANTAILNNLASQPYTNWHYENGYFYYVINKNDTSKSLKELAAGGVTDPIFETVTIPADLPNEMQHKVLKINLKAEAIQSAGQTQNGTSALNTYFAQLTTP
ncbi:MAG: hypothetical protein LBT59_24325 [Clostridiales bacterium]|jgi:hypothetical protein|nr:hypothetical protein [Clostridiales bacterium]